MAEAPHHAASATVRFIACSFSAACDCIALASSCAAHNAAATCRKATACRRVCCTCVLAVCSRSATS
eukprot:2751720-Pleurochrysis_carterae.AAC.3